MAINGVSTAVAVAQQPTTNQVKTVQDSDGDQDGGKETQEVKGSTGGNSAVSTVGNVVDTKA